MSNFDSLYLFSAGSANDHLNRHLWIKGASLFIPQINKLLEKTNYQLKIFDINSFENENSSKLGQKLAENKSDKSTSHNYHILYSFILNILGIKSNFNLLEIGLGTNNPALVSSMGADGRPGASLYAFRDYLPNAKIYGADVDKNILFQSDRINTCYVDQLEMNTFLELENQFGNLKYDLIIDDGLHAIGANFNTLLFALNNISEKGWIVIEDIQRIDNWMAIDFILQSTNKYKTYMIKAKISYLYVINKL